MSVPRLSLGAGENPRLGKPKGGGARSWAISGFKPEIWDLTSWGEYWTLRIGMFKTLLLEVVKWIRKERLDFEDQFRDY